MRQSLPEKKKVEDIDRARLREPVLTRDQRIVYQNGIALFNRQRFWEAHEAWEEVWRQRTEESRIFFQGIIQAAAGYHLLVERPRTSGAVKNLSKAIGKLDLFPRFFLDLDVEALRKSLVETLEFLGRSDAGSHRDFPPEMIPRLTKARRLQ
ncbi:MAG: DUF309 domain-containing protein [Ignavibacteriales bacterium]|nr:DUF309 domain-containing protein [Ignavibacteriales bacterium]